MTSAGGLMPARDAAELPAALLLSGPAGGVRAGAEAAVANGFADAVTIDMGGTSTDVCLVLDGTPAPAGTREVAGFTVRFPSLDVLTIGAGGGSIAGVDRGGALVVGPRSAGAEPGPACYGRGGTEPTVTDADLAAGRIPRGASMGGMTLRHDLAVAVLEGAGVTAEGVIDVVNANMERALRAVTVERGVDPRGLALVAFGGAGRLHACELAAALDMEAVVVPARAGVLSAVGILTAPVQRDLVRSWPTATDHSGPRRGAGVLGRRGSGPGRRRRARGHVRRLPLHRVEPRDHSRRRRGVRGGAPAPQRLLPFRHPDRGGGDPGDGADRLARRPRRGREPRPAALQVLVSRLTGVAEEVGAVLRRAAFSPNIKERADCSAAVFTAEGDLLVQAEHIPVHLGSMPATVRAAIDAFGGDLQPGDQIVVNDPFAGGTHLNDITLVAPCIVDGRLVGFVANRAHHADVGGAAPGSLPADATEIHQEGFRIPPTKLDDGLRRLLAANSRTPLERDGDLDAQVGANVTGVERLAAFSDAPFDEVVAYGERRMRAALAALPDGTWTFGDVLESTGAGPDQQHPSRIAVAVTVDGESIRFDFRGSSPQSRGNVNAVEAVTVSSVAFALRAALDPTIPANGGSFRPVEVVAPPGSIVAAVPPAAVGAGNVEVSQRIADVCLGALAQVVPDRVGAASQGTMNNLLIGGDGWVYYETIGGGQGGSALGSGDERRPHRDDQHRSS